MKNFSTIFFLFKNERIGELLTPSNKKQIEIVHVNENVNCGHDVSEYREMPQWQLMWAKLA